MREVNIDLAFTPQQAQIFEYQGPARFHAIAKGRRFGFTYGAATACIGWCLEYASRGEECPILWGDTVHGNLTRYVERMFLPRLRDIPHHWRQQDKQLEICGVPIDLRSAEQPQNWEGFKYRKIILNEAGLIFQDPYLYTNAVLPMMMDYANAELFAGGVPKGKILKDGREHPFYTLYKRGMQGSPLHRSLTFTSRDNPFLREEDVQTLRDEILAMSPEQVRQEIEGEFIDAVSGQLFAHKFDQGKHVKECQQIPSQAHYISLDFNIEPFCGIFAHIWEDAKGPHCWIFREESVKDATITEMSQRIKSVVPHQLLIQMTGDHGGSARRLGEKSASSMFDDLTRILGIQSRQLELPPNPPHLKSREDVNYVLVHHPDFRIDPSCKGLIRDLLSVCVEPDGKIIKADRKQVAQQSDFLDTLRYLVNTYLRRWLNDHRRGLR